MNRSTKQRMVMMAAIGLLFSTAALRGSADEKSDVGKVMEIDGVWLLNGQPVKLFQSVPSGGKISRAPDDEKKYPQLGRILILLRDKSRIIRSYETPGAERGSIELPDSVKDTTPGFWGRLKSLLPSNQEGSQDIVSTMVRGVSGHLSDNVLLLKNRRLDLGPAFQKMQNGSYLLRLRPAKAGSDSSQKPRQLTYSWDNKQPLPLQDQDLLPGLYTLVLLEKGGDDHDPTGEKALVLILPEDEYAKINAEFQEAVAIADGLGPDFSQDSRRAFICTAIQSLARNAHASGK